MYLFWLEISLSLLLPLILLSQKKDQNDGPRPLPGGRAGCAGIHHEPAQCKHHRTGVGRGRHYIPKWTEIAVTGAIIAAGFALFGLAVKYLPIFPAEESHGKTEPRPLVTTPVPGHAGD